MGLLQKFKEYIKKENLFQPKDRLIVAVSGGMDSAVLCSLCAYCGFDFSIAHCNFQLRGAESDRDEAFVKKMSELYGVPIFIKIFDTISIAKQNKTSIEETARNLRYGWFKEITDNSATDEKPFKYLLTAHHADDNVETVMMNFFRGTGIKGLRGILPKQGNIIRPLLFAGRKELGEFAKQNHIEFVTDSSNAESNYTRNFFRNELIPSVEKVFPQASQNILNNIERFADIEYLYNESVGIITNKLKEEKGEEIHIPVLKLAKTKPLRTVIYEIIKEYAFSPLQVNEAEKLLNSDSGKYIVSATHRILRNRKWLIISPLHKPADCTHHLIEEETNALLFAGGKINISHTALPDSLTATPDTAYLDAAVLKYPLQLRRWKQGDYFYPLGMQKKKKLSRFFSDIKLSLLQKEKVWVLESDKKILWVVGYRIDDRCKITAKTTGIVKLDLLYPGRINSGS